MNYKLIYDSFINSRVMLNRNKFLFSEVHHIVPKCLGGTNDSSNLVVLSCREHYFAHLLLSKIYPSLRSIQQSFLMMAARGNNVSTKGRTVTSHTYEFAKKRFINSISGKNHHYYGKSREPHVKLAISKYRLGKIPVKDINGNIFEVTKTDERYISGEVWHHSKGCSLTDEHKNKISQKTKGENNPRYSGFTDDQIVDHAIKFYKASNEIWYACKWNEYRKLNKIPLVFTKFRFKEKTLFQQMEEKLNKPIRKKKFYVNN